MCIRDRFWTLHPAGCDDVLISGIHILNDLNVANSDGIDPDHSTNVRIIGCHITCADEMCIRDRAPVYGQSWSIGRLEGTDFVTLDRCV